MEYLCIGKLVNTHGIKGEVRILSNFRYKKEVFKKGIIFYIGDEKKEYKVNTYRKHKIFDMFTFDSITDINDVLHLKGLDVYINKENLKLENNKLLAIDLIGFSVIIDGTKVGIINEILDTPASEVLVLDNKVMIPYVEEFII
ncbi:MAG TPA: ribosome maturation factor RimM, partial [Bacilli bacterium]|nr:ribosome maturation factor RimM [Bacilli bacterium]